MTHIRPSSLPALAVSPRFESGKSTEAATLGQDRHIALSDKLTSDGALLALVNPNEVEGVKWAGDYILEVARKEDQPIRSEFPLTIRDRSGQELMRGTSDAICGDHLFDLKWRGGDYKAQMAAYALGLMQMRNTRTAFVHLLFAATKQSESYVISRNEAENIVFEITEKVRNPQTVCKVSEFCKWCKHSSGCSVLGAKVEIVEDHVAKVKPMWNLSTPHGLGAALTLALEVEMWVDSIFALAEERALSGEEVTGYYLADKSAPRKLKDGSLPALHAALGLSPDVFLSACRVSLPKLEASFVQANRDRIQPKLLWAELDRIISPLLEERKTTKTLVKR